MTGNAALSVEARIRALAVKLVLEGRVEEALETLSKHYGVPTPRVRVGMPKGLRNVPACYLPSKRTIYVRSSSEYRNPFIVLHEFYHHIRMFNGRHRGCESRADEYALNSIRYYLTLIKGDESAID